MSINLVLAFAMALNPVPSAAPVPIESGCKITSPPEGWPGGGVPGYNTRLHIGLNNDWANQVRPIGDVKAIMLFVDFPNAVAPDSTQVHYDFLVPESVEFFRTASYGKFRLTVDAPQKWYRMSKPDTEYGMGYIISPEVQAVYIQEAIRLAESDVDFTQYSHIYLVPPKNAKAVPYSPEWNDYRGVVTGDGIVVIAVLLMAGLQLLVMRTKVGRAMRAIAADPKAAHLVGVDVNRVISQTFFLGSMLAGAAGMMTGAYYGRIDFLMGFLIGLKAFTAAVIGGIGNLPGAMLGGLALGLLESFGTHITGGQWRDVFAFGFLILFLVLRPSGILGEKVAVRM